MPQPFLLVRQLRSKPVTLVVSLSMWVRLTRKLADFVDGVDISHRHVGDVFELPVPDANLLIAEAWAEPHSPAIASAHARQRQHQKVPAANWRQSLVQRLRQMRERIELRSALQEGRRIEDRVREELRDSRAVVVTGRPRTTDRGRGTHR
jgi:hypothetical protein